MTISTIILNGDSSPMKTIVMTMNPISIAPPRRGESHLSPLGFAPEKRKSPVRITPVFASERRSGIA